jgi:putative copper export protein/methionine-rich copper-binding protein CopC
MSFVTICARRVFSIFLLLLVLAIFVSPLFPHNASAHNREKTSDPANGSVLSVAPKQITFYFKQAVGEDSLTVLLIDPTGSRIPLRILRAAQLEAVAEIPPIQDGVYSARWKLISSDGHPVTNKVTFTVDSQGALGAASSPETQLGSTVPTSSVLPNTVLPNTVVPTSLPTVNVPTVPAVVSAETVLSSSDVTPSDVSLSTLPAPAVALETESAGAATVRTLPVAPPELGNPDQIGAPNWSRWLLRFGSYLAIFVVVGIITTSRWVWKKALTHPALHRAAVLGSSATAGLAMLQILVLANDIDAPSLVESLWRVRLFDAGVGYVARIVLAVAMLVILRMLRRNKSLQSVLNASAFLAVGLLITWSYVGHAKSQRWSWIGLPVDVVHHASAAAWIGSLAIVGFVAPSFVEPGTLNRMLRRLSAFAQAAVIVMIASGVLQSFRLVGTSKIFEGAHTKLLVAKIFAVVVMLLLANVNRRRVIAISDEAAESKLQRTIVVEFVVGLIVIALTSSLVVASPAISQL